MPFLSVYSEPVPEAFSSITAQGKSDLGWIKMSGMETQNVLHAPGRLHARERIIGGRQVSKEDKILSLYDAKDEVIGPTS
jgi:hypothetical protein